MGKRGRLARGIGFVAVVVVVGVLAGGGVRAASLPVDLAVKAFPGLAPPALIAAGDVHVLAWPESAEGTGAMWAGVRSDGSVAWQRRRDGPDFHGPFWYDHHGTLALVGAGRVLAAIDARDGKEVWRREVDKPLGVVVLAGGRVYASAADGRLRVFDAGTGAPRGDLALGAASLVTAQSVGDRTSITVGERNGQGISGITAHDAAGFEARSELPGALWTTAGDPAAFTAVQTGGAVLVRPHRAWMSAVDAVTGDRLWIAPVPRMVPVMPSPRNVLFFSTDGGGKVRIGALRSEDLTVLWERAWPGAAPPTAIDVEGVNDVFANRDGFVVLSSTDGSTLAEEVFAGAPASAGVSAAARSVVVLRLDGPAPRVEVVPFAGAAGAPPAPPPLADVPWMAAGTRLHYALVQYEGRRPGETLWREMSLQDFVVTIEDVGGGGITFAWVAEDGRSGRRRVPADVFAHSQSHSDFFGDAPPDEVETVGATSVWLGRGVMGELLAGRGTGLDDASALRPDAVVPKGRSYFSVSLDDAAGRRRVDLPVVVAKGKHGEGHYRLLRSPDWPLIVGVERPSFAVYLERIEVPKGAAGDGGPPPGGG